MRPRTLRGLLSQAGRAAAAARSADQVMEESLQQMGVSLRAALRAARDQARATTQLRQDLADLTVSLRATRQELDDLRRCRRSRHTPPDLRRAIVARAFSGEALTDLAREVGVSRERVRQWVRAVDPTWTRRDHIRTQREGRCARAADAVMQGGFSRRAAAKQHGVGYQDLCQWMRDQGLKAPPVPRGKRPQRVAT